MRYTAEKIKELSRETEGEHFDRKAGRSDFSMGELEKYCVAFANAGGGVLLLGVTDKGEIIGTNAFNGVYHEKPNEIKSKTGCVIHTEEVKVDGKRLLVFEVARGIAGKVYKDRDGKAWTREGSSTTEMTEEERVDRAMKGRADFSAEIVPGLSVGDLDEEAVEEFKKLWALKTRRKDLGVSANEKILRDIGALKDKGVTWAGLILFGRAEKIREILPCAEIIYEWRSDERTSHEDRQEWRGAFFIEYNEIWKKVSARNSRIPFQQGLIQREVFAFDEQSIREALMNAIAHRDYQRAGGVIFIHASPEKISITSPGGLLPGITVENIFGKCEWRNKLLAEILQHAGLVERSGQGIDTIFRKTIGDGKGMPDFRGTDEAQVVLNIPARIKDPQFVGYIEKIVNENQIMLSFEDIYELEKIRGGRKDIDGAIARKLLSSGIIERVGKTKGTRYILAQRWYVDSGRPGQYTRIAGLSREAKKELILKHLRNYKLKGGVSAEIQDALGIDSGTVANMLQELKREDKIRAEGVTRYARWYIK